MRKLFCAVGLFVLGIGFLFAQEQKTEEIRLTLNECLEIALEKNLDISVEAFNPEIQEFSVRQARELFMPQLTLDYGNYRYNQLSNWFIEGTQFIQNSNDYTVGVQQKIITGGTFALSLRNSTEDTTRKGVAINPSYSGRLIFSIDQPILKNFGPKINRKEIKKARNQVDISTNSLKTTLFQKIYEVEDAYWRLVSAIESLRVNESRLEYSREQLKKAKEGARIGSKTATDVLDAETNVANWEDNIIRSQAQVQSAEDNLRKILNLSADEAGALPRIVPTDRPTVEKKEITFEEALNTALKQRPEMASKDKEIENSSIDVSYSKNQLLPELNMRFNLYYPGQSGDRIFYVNNDPINGDIDFVIPGSRSEYLKDIFGFKYENWYLTLSLTIPLENILSRASLAQARVQKEQKLLEKERLYKDIYNEIMEVFKELKNNEKRLETSARYRELMEKKLDAAEEKYRLGALSSDWLYSYQRDMANARVSEIGAIIDYKLSVANSNSGITIFEKPEKGRFNLWHSGMFTIE
jgi:outer membrane protein TolC